MSGKLGALLAFAWIISEHRRAVAWKPAAAGLLLTFATALILLKVPGVARIFAGFKGPRFVHLDGRGDMRAIGRAIWSHVAPLL